MAKAPLVFRQRDVMRAIRAARAAGCTIYGIEIDQHGRIVVLTSPEAVDNRRPESEGRWSEADGELV